ncbi:hypothetical protein [Ornithinimicrobium avium]|uniref:Lipoprotein n=1 Tax=Ornithinimicrobium avium TaxID=2283195 RepID=A0A345NM48_9MICO|nr:hypothetical protein [Ornithinimicrobium avium]AXH96106.1 hypothetical protein DV701_08160 [Ornithinimicrobium avium]
MKLSRQTAAAVLASALVLTACTGDGATPQDTTSPSAASTTTEDQAATAGPDEDAATTSAAPEAAGSTAGPTDDAASSTAEMTTDPARAAMSVEDAEAVASTVLDARLKALQTNGKKAREARRDAFGLAARIAAAGADKTEKVFGRPAEAKDDQAATPNVLAISRADGELPVVLLVQTVRGKKTAPVLHLMTSSTGKAEDFRITWEARMLPGTELPVFDRRSVGSPVLRKGAGDLQASPRKSLSRLAASLTWPRQEDLADFRTNGYGPAVRRANNEQANAVARQATMREKNRVRKDGTTTLVFEDGSAFVTGTIRRDTTFRVKNNSILNPPDSFRVFVDDGELTDEAVLRTSVMVGLRVPAEDQSFKPEVIAVTEQLVDAWGS